MCLRLEDLGAKSRLHVSGLPARIRPRDALFDTKMGGCVCRADTICTSGHRTTGVAGDVTLVTRSVGRIRPVARALPMRRAVRRDADGLSRGSAVGLENNRAGARTKGAGSEKTQRQKTRPEIASHSIPSPFSDPRKERHDERLRTRYCVDGGAVEESSCPQGAADETVQVWGVIGVWRELSSVRRRADTTESAG